MQMIHFTVFSSTSHTPPPLAEASVRRRSQNSRHSQLTRDQFLRGGRLHVQVVLHTWNFSHSRHQAAQSRSSHFMIPICHDHTVRSAPSALLLRGSLPRTEEGTLQLTLQAESFPPWAAGEPSSPLFPSAILLLVLNHYSCNISYIVDQLLTKGRYPLCAFYLSISWPN